MFINNSEDLKLINSNNTKDKNKLFTKYSKVIFGLYYKKIKDVEIAKDLTQDVLLKIFDNLQSYKSTFPFNKWVYTIANNFLTDYYRTNKSKNAIIENSFLDSNSDFIIENKFTDKNKIEKDLDNKEIIKLIDNNVYLILTELEWQIYDLVFKQEYTYNEIENELGIVRASTSQICKRIKSKIKKFLVEKYITI